MKPCQTPYCKNQVPSGKLCSKCRKRKFRKNSPFKYFYGKLKESAKARNKPFTLTLEEFTALWRAHPEKWKEKLDTENVCTWEVDRIKEEEGYHAGNLQLVKKRFNVQKYHKYYASKDQNVLEFEPDWLEETETKETDAPF